MSVEHAFEDDVRFPESRPDWWEHPGADASSMPRDAASRRGGDSRADPGQWFGGSGPSTHWDSLGEDVAADAALPSADQAVQRLLTIPQAAKRLQVGRCTLQALVLDGSIRSFKIGRLRRIPPEALDEYISRASES